MTFEDLPRLSSNHVVLPLFLFERMASAYYGGPAQPASDPGPEPEDSASGRDLGSLSAGAAYQILQGTGVPPGFQPANDGTRARYRAKRRDGVTPESGPVRIDDTDDHAD